MTGTKSLPALSDDYRFGLNHDFFVMYFFIVPVSCLFTTDFLLFEPMNYVRKRNPVGLVSAEAERGGASGELQSHFL